MKINEKVQINASEKTTTKYINTNKMFNKHILINQTLNTKCKQTSNL